MLEYVAIGLGVLFVGMIRVNPGEDGSFRIAAVIFTLWISALAVAGAAWLTGNLTSGTFWLTRMVFVLFGGLGLRVIFRGMFRRPGDGLDGKVGPWEPPRR